MSSDSISVRGARQHNLKNIDVDIPLHRLTVLTGLSGSGKSSLAFDTLYAEGQRRYVETFSPYTRQFLERMDKPDVDRIDGIPPAIAIEQSNPVKTSRSTVGTLTEIADYSKMLMTHAARLECPKCQREIRPGNASSIAAQILGDCTGQEITIGFTVAFPRRPTLASVLDSLRQQGFVRVSIDGKIVRTDEPPTKNVKAPAELFVIQDRLTVDPKNRARLGEAVEVALRHGQGVVRVQAGTTELRFTDRWYCPYDQIEFKAPVPALFSFNNPLGACPICRGFGRTIEIDYELALPNRELSIAQGVVKPWQSGMSKECQKDLLRFCRKQGIPTDVPFSRLTRTEQRFVIDGESKSGIPQEDLWDNNRWYGVKGFFKWLETKTYKMHVRVFLSRYRVYKLCPTCHGARFQPETLQFKLVSSGKKLDLAAINQLPLREAKTFFEQLPLPPDDEAAAQLRGEIATRLSYLLSVGLGYLTLDRATRTLSGGEIQRVNLTSCLGNSLVNTLFVLDEPTIGLHPRDTKQLVDVVKSLRDRGNTLVVVEHEEALMREADHLVDLGPGRGELGGSVVYSGSYSGLVRSKKSLTGRYLSGETKIPLPVTRRQPRKDSQLNLRGASSHNLKNIDVDVPLGLFVAITGVSGSGKSTLVHDVLYANLLKAKNQAGHHSIEPGELREIRHADLISEVIEVDQSPLSRTSRSNPAVYLGVYDEIRKCFGETEAAVAQGLSASDFSFNGGNGRCPRCGGAGTERIEMQFLADVFITCPVCEGKRFQPHILALTYRGKSIDDVLKMTCHEARQFFSPDLPDLDPPQKRSHRKIGQTLEMIEQVGLGYLRLGQPLQQLSGGEAQRIKLLSYLREATERPRDAKANCGRLFILDEPTTGLHFEDIRLLIELLQKIVSQGDSLIVIEHNLDVIKCADWIIDLGPEAGDGGGLVVAAGTPEEIAQVESSHTGQYLRSKLVPGNRLRELPPLPAITKLRPLKNDRLIRIRGARHHNLKDISLDVHLDEMTVVTGLSGSGKSTLAFDLLFAEGQRRYLDSLNAYARQFVEPMEKPDVDSITGIPPAVAIEQRVTRGGHKSTIATVAEIHQFLRLLFAKIGRVFDPDTSEMAVRQTPEEIFHRLEKASRAGKLTLLAPLVRGRKGFHTDVARWASRKGYPLLRVDGRWIEPDKFKALDRYVEHTIDVVVGDLTASQSTAARRQLMHVALGLGHGTIYAIDRRKTETIYSTHLFCPSSGRSFDELEPRLFSFNSPHGWCPRCQGYGTLWDEKVDGDTEIERELALEGSREASDDGVAQPLCPVCHGQRLNPLALAVRLPARSPKQPGFCIGEIGELSIDEALVQFQVLKLIGRDAAIARDIVPEIIQRLKFLREVGLGYLTLDRSSPTLSGGEAQRIRLAAQLGSNLRGVLYVLDEPTIGLHPQDNARLLDSLQALKARGNTLVVVEHDEDTIRQADRIIDLGPGAGVEGGRIVADGPLKNLVDNKKSLTAQCLKQPMTHPLLGLRRPIGLSVSWLKIEGAAANNLKKINVDLPAGRLICVCGVSGAGKSTLLHDIVKPAVAAAQRRGKKNASQPWKKVIGADLFSAVYEVDQAPIGKTSRSTPSTYIGVMDELRALYAQVPLAKQRGYSASRFSFNSGAGRCSSCGGLGEIKVAMSFLPTMYIPCEVCEGKRYNAETLDVLYNSKNIADVLTMSVAEAALLFAAVPRLQRPLQLLCDTGLGYLTLGQRSPTLSGGESQRIKLVTELARSLHVNMQKRLRTPGFERAHHLYLLEEPTIGLHMIDVERLLRVLHRLVDAGHTVIVIEHNLDVIAEADYIIELGPSGGSNGGRVIAAGTPEQAARVKHSPTAPFLAATLKKSTTRIINRKTPALISEADLIA